MFCFTFAESSFPFRILRDQCQRGAQVPSPETQTLCISVLWPCHDFSEASALGAQAESFFSSIHSSYMFFFTNWFIDKFFLQAPSNAEPPQRDGDARRDSLTIRWADFSHSEPPVLYVELQHDGGFGGDFTTTLAIRRLAHPHIGTVGRLWGGRRLNAPVSISTSLYSYRWVSQGSVSFSEFFLVLFLHSLFYILLFIFYIFLHCSTFSIVILYSISYIAFYVL